MKLLIKSCLLVLAMTTIQLNAAVGCMNNSRDLTQTYDYKDYHYVQCNCPCGSNSTYKILADRGICRECRHYHEAKPIQLIKGSAPTTKQLLSSNPIMRYFQEKGSLLF